MLRALLRRRKNRWFFPSDLDLGSRGGQFDEGLWGVERRDADGIGGGERGRLYFRGTS